MSSYNAEHKFSSWLILSGDVLCSGWCGVLRISDLKRLNQYIFNFFGGGTCLQEHVPSEQLFLPAYCVRYAGAAGALFFQDSTVTCDVNGCRV